jgi:hypothetical protein
VVQYKGLGFRVQGSKLKRHKIHVEISEYRVYNLDKGFRFRPAALSWKLPATSPVSTQNALRTYDL